METTKEYLLKITKVLIMVGTIADTVATAIFFYLHIKMLPVDIVFYPQEVMLLLCMIPLLLFSKRYKLKYFNAIAIIGIILGTSNLVGFRIITSLFMRG